MSHELKKEDGSPIKAGDLKEGKKYGVQYNGKDAIIIPIKGQNTAAPRPMLTKLLTHSKEFRVWDNEENTMELAGAIDWVCAFGVLSPITVNTSTKKLYQTNLDDSRFGFVLMQWSGLRDRADQKIYELDVIEYTDFRGKKHTQVCPSLDWFHWWQETEDNETVKVIGNIYQNPNLIPTV